MFYQSVILKKTLIGYVPLLEMAAALKLNNLTSSIFLLS